MNQFIKTNRHGFGVKTKLVVCVWVVLLMEVFSLLLPENIFLIHILPWYVFPGHVVSGRVRAQVVINEFSPNTDREWVEIYNLDQAEVDLAGWKLVDKSNKIENLTGSMGADGYFVFERDDGWLNNSGGDALFLRNDSDELVDSISYGGTGDAVGNPSLGKSIGRVSDGSGVWTADLTPTKGVSNFSEQPTSAPSAEPTPTPTSAPTRAIYKINKSNDNSGSELSGVKIYVDDNYIHHEDYEILEFYAGHECDSGINCGLGVHTISLEKEGYSNWEDNRDFQAGTNLEVNPVLNKVTVETASPTSTPSPSPAIQPKPSVIKTPSSNNPSAQPSPLLDVLGAGTTLSPSPQIQESEGSKPGSNKISIAIGILLILFGSGLVGFTGLTVFRDIKKSYTSSNDAQDN